MSQDELAARAEVSRSTIQNAEQGKRTPQPASLKRIARALGTDVAHLNREDGLEPSASVSELEELRDMLNAALERLERLARRL